MLLRLLTLLAHMRNISRLVRFVIFGLAFVAAAPVFSQSAQVKRFVIYDGRQYRPDQYEAAVKSPIPVVPPQRTQSGAFLIPRAADGHFYVYGTVNGFPVVFMIDTGATETSIPVRVAKNAGIRAGLEVVIETASGKSTAGQSTGNALSVGPFLVQNTSVLISSSLDRPLLGMNAMSRFVITYADGAMLLSENPKGGGR